MRKPEYLSPSAYFTWKQDPQEYYLKYLCDFRPPKFPQTLAMAVGSSFDAHVKSYLHTALFGDKDPKYNLGNLFESQVESHNRSTARGMGLHCFNEYKDSGALADLMLELNGAVDEPRFEFDLRGTVNGHREGVTKDFGIVLLGKPDLKFINAEGASVVYDWKVNGYCGKATTSPMQGYVKLRAQDKTTGYWVNQGCHKDALVTDHKGIKINRRFFEEFSEDWATQLAVYHWLMGGNVGSQFVGGVDQIVGKNNGAKPPILRFASHRSMISEDFQFKIFGELQDLWSRIYDEPCWFFREKSLEESQYLQSTLEDQAKMFGRTDLSDDERWILDVSRGIL